MQSMNLPTTQKPHAPTLVVAIVAILLVVLVYHMMAGRKR